MRYRAMLLCLLVLGCSKHETPRMQNADTLTQRQRDSVIGASGLPGAQAIPKAQGAQDLENRHVAQAESIARADST